ncbi:dihydrofolate reductase [Alkalibacillus aidingensis]|uniref:dihydrofolate reductase n=1 Tax=Alkalibacillus aidingensis TaxID=2747607 RepID=UPI0016608EB9|nr:dihydrofolate reductase [Alkalibacillus aidingensis]
MYSLIVAMDENQAIGYNKGMPWHLPNDLKYFKEVTQGHPIVMGRKTFESIGRPLPKRHNIIMTRDPQYQQEGCTIIHSWDQLKEVVTDENEVFIIGGSELFQIAMPHVSRMYLTVIHEQFPADTYFPEVDFSEWNLVKKIRGERDEKNVYGHTFYVYDRK